MLTTSSNGDIVSSGGGKEHDDYVPDPLGDSQLVTLQPVNCTTLKSYQNCKLKMHCWKPKTKIGKLRSTNSGSKTVKYLQYLRF